MYLYRDPGQVIRLSPGHRLAADWMPAERGASSSVLPIVTLPRASRTCNDRYGLLKRGPSSPGIGFYVYLGARALKEHTNRFLALLDCVSSVSSVRRRRLRNRPME